MRKALALDVLPLATRNLVQKGEGSMNKRVKHTLTDFQFCDFSWKEVDSYEKQLAKGLLVPAIRRSRVRTNPAK